MTKRRRWILLPLAALAAIVLVVLLLFDWNWLKGPLEGAVSAALERQFEVADLDVDLSSAPTITLDRVRIANAEWGSRPDMLSVPQVRLVIALWPLLKGEIELPFLRVEEPDLLLETNREGLANWKFGEQDQPEAPPVIPIIGDLEVANAAIRYHEPDRPQDLAAALETVDGAITGSGIQLSAKGSLDDEPLSLRLASAPAERLEAETEAERFPFELNARLGATRLAATGSAERLLQAQGLSVEIAVQSENPGPLLVLAGRGRGDLGHLDLTFSLTGQDQIWTLQQIDLQLGESDLSGDVSFSNQGDEPAIAADLHSNHVQLAAVRDVIALLTEGSGKVSGEPGGEAALAEAQATLANEAQGDSPADDADLGVSPAMLPAIDAEVSYTINRLSGPEVALQGLDLYGRLKDRLPHVALSGSGQYQGEPVRIDVQAGDPGAKGSDGYPIRANLVAAGTQAEIEGALTRPAELAGLELRFEVASRDLDQLLALADVEVPEIPPFEVNGRLDQGGSRWRLSEFEGRLGDSDIQGRATVDLGEREPVITAELASDQVRLEDLQALLPQNGARATGTGPEIDAAIAEAKAALADDKQSADAGGLGLHPDMLPRIDAEVSYTVSRFSGPDLALTDLDLHARLEDGLPRLELSGGGEYQGTPVALDVQLGGAEQAAEAAYPVEARIEAAATHIEIDGVIGQPETLDGLDLKVQASSEDINNVVALVNVDLPEIPQFAINGHVVQDGQVWRIGDFYGQFSESELAGQLAIDLSDQRPFITADLQSNRLLVSDLVTAGDKAAVVEDEVAEVAAEAKEKEEVDAEEVTEDEVDGTAGEADPKDQDEAALISAAGINFEALPEIDADIAFQGQFVEYGEFRFDQLSFDLQLRDDIVVLNASGDGQYQDGPLLLEAHAGTKANLENPNARYPIDVRLDSEETNLAVNGTVGRPGQVAGLDIDVALEGPDLDRMGEILQLSLPTTPPFDLQSHLTLEENRWNFTGLNGTIGDSDIQGDATIVLGGERPILEAELTSDRLDFDDLGLLVGAPADPEETVSVEQERAAAEEAATRGVLPDEPFDVPELRAMDARVSYRAKQVQAPHLPLEGVVLDLSLEDGQLTLEPLRFDLADGALDSVIQLNGRSDTLVGDLELNVRNIRLNRLLAEFDIEIAEIEMEQEGVGTFGGRAELKVRGNSIQELAGSADGEVALIMRGGRINALIVEGIGLDVGEAVALLLAGDEEQQSEMVPIQCFVARFDVQDGVMQTEALVLETSDSTITGRGSIDLGEETLSLELLAHPKDTSALSASTPVRIEGTLAEPQIDPVSKELQEKSLTALALGVVMPVIGAILPFFEEGETKDTNCAGLIQAASAAMEGDPSPEQPEE